MTTVWRAFFTASAVLLGFLVLSVPFVEPGSATFVISAVSFAMLAVIFVASAVFIRADWDPFEELW
ncbi:hypothetical protein [Halosimplex pelagicum]|uniref:DUF4175 domain-containing protein n=1 Tax=Halosimplex pelagicum TaxID=869886 RepID=A0A7D5THQ0_9EURY|nr:hypothetical protein [Halosimplex pelagicum]QLH83076.1 hypothetical protein HZS54_16240 [Halosimplex pelagicum]